MNTFNNQAMARAEFETDRVEAWADKVLGEAFEQKKFSGLVLTVVQDGAIVMNKGYGYADYDSKTPVDPAATGFRIGSVSKPFTATAIAQLVERGLIKSLDDPANFYLKRYQLPRNGTHEITLWDLLTHQAGFEDKASGIGIIQDQSRIISSEYIKNITPDLVRASGKWSVYDNFGSSLLGTIIEDITGQLYADYLQENIFAPLAMTNAVVGDAASPTPGLGRAYATYPNGTMEPVPFLGIPPFFAPVGAINATGSDMANYMIANLAQGRGEAGSILKTTSFETLHNIHRKNHPAFGGWGMLFKIQHWDSEKLVKHSGGWIGASTDMALMMDSNAGVFISVMSGKGSNPLDDTENPDFEFKGTLNVEETLKAFLTEFIGPYRPAESVFVENFETSDLSRYVGSYFTNRRTFSSYEILDALLTGRFSVELEEQGGLKILGLEGFEEIAPAVFWHKEAGGLLAFVEDEQGLHIAIDGNPGYFTRVSGFSDPATVLRPLPVFVLILFTGLIAAFWASPTGVGKNSRWLAVAAPLCVLAMVGFLKLGFERGKDLEYNVLAGMTGRFIGLITMANILAVLGLVMLIVCIKAWRENYWGTGKRAMGRRIHFTLVTISVLGLIPALFLANLLGVNMP